MHLTESQKSSLFRLLSDDDPSTLTLVKRQLLEGGAESVPELESWLREAQGSPVERHLAEVLGRLKKGHCHQEFLDFCVKAAMGPEIDLEGASFLLASTEYPSTDMSRYRHELDDIAEEVRVQIAQKGHPSEIRALSFVLHEKRRFRGNRDRYFEAENTYLNRVLERHVGIPLTLSLLYILLGKRVGLEIHGVALPGHFIVSWQGKYFDPFNYGRLLSTEACKEIVEARGHEFRPEQLEAASSKQVLIRMLSNLLRIYELEEDRNRMAGIKRYLQALEVKT
jgi:regulator of sirC expression with transglutaminase-like and TPR domain